MKRFMAVVFACVSLMTVLTGSRAAAWDEYPDWQAGGPVSRFGGAIYSSEGVDAVTRGCTQEMVRVGSDGPAPACVTHMDGWRYALHTRYVMRYGMTTSELMFIVGLGSDEKMYGVTGMPVSVSPLALAGTDTLVYKLGDTLEAYPDFPAYLVRTDEGYALSARPARTYTYADGTPLTVGGIGVDRNGEWLGAQTPYGIARISLKTGDIRLVHPLTVSDGRFSGSMDIAVSDDGQVIAVGGRLYGERRLSIISVNDGCGTRGRTPEWGVSACPAQDAAGLFDDGSLPAGMPVGLRFGTHGTRLDFFITRPDGWYSAASLYPYGSAPAMIRYLALGDSYSSGEGDTGRTVAGAKYYLTHTDDAASGDTCHLSSRSFPFQLAGLMDNEGLGVLTHPVKSVACSGARIDDIAPGPGRYAGQYGRLGKMTLAGLSDARAHAMDMFIPGRVRQSDFADAYQPAAMTVGVGGNDVQFSHVIEACVYSFVTCDYAGDPTDRRNLGEAIRGLLPRLTALYAGLVRADPLARIYAVGYPRFVNDTNAACPLTTNLDAAERRMADEGVRYINQVIRTAAMNAGIGYLDVSNALAGHRLCDGDDPYVNGIDILGGDQDRIETFHPNAAGHGMMAMAIRSQYGADLAQGHYCPGDRYPCPRPTAVPDLPAYFGDGSVRPTTVALPSELVALDVTGHVTSLVKGAEVIVQAALLLKGSTVRMEIHSDTVALGTATVGEDGAVRAAVTVPDSVSPGYHTLHLYGTSPSGEQVDMYQIVTVREPIEDSSGTSEPVKGPTLISSTPSRNPCNSCAQDNEMRPSLPAILPMTVGRYPLVATAVLAAFALACGLAARSLWRRLRP